MLPDGRVQEQDVVLRRPARSRRPGCWKRWSRSGRAPIPITWPVPPARRWSVSPRVAASPPGCGRGACCVPRLRRISSVLERRIQIAGQSGLQHFLRQAARILCRHRAGSAAWGSAPASLRRGAAPSAPRSLRRSTSAPGWIRPAPSAVRRILHDGKSHTRRRSGRCSINCRMGELSRASRSSSRFGMGLFLTWVRFGRDGFFRGAGQALKRPLYGLAGPASVPRSICPASPVSTRLSGIAGCLHLLTPRCRGCVRAARSALLALPGRLGGMLERAEQACVDQRGGGEIRAMASSSVWASRLISTSALRTTISRPITSPCTLIGMTPADLPSVADLELLERLAVHDQRLARERHQRADAVVERLVASSWPSLPAGCDGRAAGRPCSARRAASASRSRPPPPARRPPGCGRRAGAGR